MISIRTSALTLAQLIYLKASLALAAPFFSAGVGGVADANASSRPCALSGDVSEGYRTFPLDSFVAFAQGRATGFNPCSALSGSAWSVSSANLASGKLRVFALAQLGMAPFQQEARAVAYFSDDVNLFFGGQQVTALPSGLNGEIRLDVHGSRSAQLLDAGAKLEIDALNGVRIGDVDVEDLKGGESLVVPFNQPFHFYAQLSVTAADGEHADFGSTGEVSIKLPEGYTFQSASGVLLAVPDSGPEILLTAIRKDVGLEVTWAGGAAPFILQGRTNLTSGTWTDLIATSTRTATVPLKGPAEFLRVVGQ